MFWSCTLIYPLYLNEMLRKVRRNTNYLINPWLLPNMIFFSVTRMPWVGKGYTGIYHKDNSCIKYMTIMVYEKLTYRYPLSLCPCVWVTTSCLYPGHLNMTLVEMAGELQAEVRSSWSSGLDILLLFRMLLSGDKTMAKSPQGPNQTQRTHSPPPIKTHHHYRQSIMNTNNSNKRRPACKFSTSNS